MFLLNTACLLELAAQKQSSQRVETGDDPTYGLLVRDTSTAWPIAYGAGTHVDVFMANMISKLHSHYHAHAQLAADVSGVEWGADIVTLGPELFSHIKTLALREAIVDFINRVYWVWVDAEFVKITQARRDLVPRAAAYTRTFCVGCQDGWVKDSDGRERFKCRADCMPFQQEVASRVSGEAVFSTSLFTAVIDRECVNPRTKFGAIYSRFIRPLDTQAEVAEPLGRYGVFGTERIRAIKLRVGPTADVTDGPDEDTLSCSELSSIAESEAELEEALL